MIKNEENALFNERQAAEYFGWSVYTMREIRKRGEIEFVRFNNRTIRYTTEQLEDYKSRHMNSMAEPGKE
jgi:predicted site-specific integrase-resolvase